MDIVHYPQLDSFLAIVTTSLDGLLFLGVGTIVGAILSTILFSLTVISMPLLIDKEIDVVTAMIFSVKICIGESIDNVMLGTFGCSAIIFSTSPQYFWV